MNFKQHHFIATYGKTVEYVMMRGSNLLQLVPGGSNKRGVHF
jgi:hypothetical protein